jgi:hypothetical protein
MKTKKSILALFMFINLLFIRNVNAQCGYALEFEASNFSNVWSENITDVANNFTMEFWVKPTKIIKTGMIETVALGNDYNSTGEQSYVIRPDWYPVPDPLDPVIWSETGTYNIGGHAGAGVSVGTNGIAVFEHSAWYLPAILVWYTPVSSSVWTHIAVVYIDKTPSLYINGSWVHTGVTSLKSFVHPSACLSDEWGYGPFGGTIDEVRIWDVALSAGTISNWYNNPVTSSHPDYEHLNTYLKLNEGSGDIVSDASGNGHYGVFWPPDHYPTWISGWLPEGATTPTVDAGPDLSTYFGIASMQQVTRTAVVSGGTPPYLYEWTLGRPLLCNQVNSDGDESFSGGTCENNTCPASGSPSVNPSCSESATINSVLIDTATVCVTVTDANGCMATDCFTVMASDVRCFAGNSSNQKVLMCHHTSSQSNPWVSICVDANSIDAHLAHGDYIGSCSSSKSAAISETNPDPDFTIYPNPFTNEFTIKIESKIQVPGSLIIYDLTGKMTEKHENLSPDVTYKFGSGLNKGMYLVVIRQGDQVQNFKIVKTN